MCKTLFHQEAIVYTGTGDRLLNKEVITEGNSQITSPLIASLFPEVNKLILSL